MGHIFSAFIGFVLLKALCIHASMPEKDAFIDKKHLFSSSVKEGLTEAQFYKNKRVLYWGENYQKALKNCKEAGKSLLIAFVGSEWCPWSQKLQLDVLIKPDFIKILKNDFVFLWIEFPENLSSTEKGEKEQLKEKYSIQELPTLVLIDPDGEEMTKIGFMPFEAKEFAVYLIKLHEQFKEIKDCIENFNLKNCTFEELKDYYARADSFTNKDYREKILNVGLQIDEGSYFLLEKYAAFIKNGKIKDPEVLSLRKKITDSDPKNLDGVHLRLAMLDFQKLSSHIRKRDKPAAAIEPLLMYLKEFGQNDLEHVWQIEMTIAKYLFSKGLIQPALEHAKESYKAAPEKIKRDIAQSIDYLEAQNNVK